MFKNVWFFSLLMVGSFFLWGCVSFEWVPSVVGMTGLWVGDCGEVDCGEVDCVSFE